MSETPRTDARCLEILNDALGLEYVANQLQYWAEELERENAALRAELDAVRGERPAFERELSGLTDKTCAQTRLIQDLALMCRRMSYALNRNRVEDTLVRQCIDLLKKHDLGGQVIRTHAPREEGQG